MKKVVQTTRDLLITSMVIVLTACGGNSVDKGIVPDDFQYLPFQNEEGEYVFISTEDGEILDIGTFNFAYPFYDGYAMVVDAENHCYFIDKKGNELFKDSAFVNVTPFQDGLAWVVKEKGYPQAINKKGEIKVSLKHAERAFVFHNGYAVYTTADRIGIVDTEGKEYAINGLDNREIKDVTPIIVNDLLAVHVKAVEESGVDNQLLIFTKKKDSFECVTVDDLHPVSKSGGFNNRTEYVLNFLQAFSEDRIPAQNAKEKWGVYHSNDLTAPFIYNEFDNIALDGSNYVVKKGELYGWIDAKGEYLINPQFIEVTPFGASNLAGVRTKTKDGFRWGFIDMKGDWVIEPQFDKIQPFDKCSVAQARDPLTEKWGLIDKDGEWIVRPQFEVILPFGLEDRFFVWDSEVKIGVIDSDGKYIIHPVFNNVTYYPEYESNYTIQSKYVDLQSIAADIITEIGKLKATTTGKLRATYSIDENKFPIPSGIVKLFDTTTTYYKLKISTYTSPWSKTFDGWFGYNYNFLPDTPVKSYTMAVSFKDKAEKCAVEIMDLVRANYVKDGKTFSKDGMNDETSIFTANQAQISLESLGEDSFTLKITY